MGLDMFLTKKTFIGAKYDHRNVVVDLNVSINGKTININPKKILEISETVGYWRKANHIHNWFVENVQSGNDDCGDYIVERKQLEELLNICKQVKDNPDKAKELLPTTPGFFFGSQDYGEYYMQNIDHTIKLLEDLPDEIESYDVSYEYHSSW